jgi:hypothetical protein
MRNSDLFFEWRGAKAMKRGLVGLTLFTCLSYVSPAPVRAADWVFLKADPAKPIIGTLVSESPSGVKLKVRGETKLFPAAEILDVTYDFQSGFKLDYNRAIGADKAIASATTASKRTKALKDALKEYQGVLPRLKAKDFSLIRRNVEYRIAVLTVRLAQEDGSNLASGIGKLKQFTSKNAGGWQIVPAAQMLGQLLIVEGKAEDAEQVYKDLSANTDLPQDARSAFQLSAARLSMRPGKYAEANTKLQALIDKLPKGSRQTIRARIYQAECLAGLNRLAEAEAKLNAILDEVKKDKEVRAQAYNTLGQCRYQAKNYQGALWDFLRVDVVYYQNREEHARALYYLVDLFKKKNDLKRSEECRAKLKSKAYSGTEYQMRLLKNDKGL